LGLLHAYWPLLEYAALLRSLSEDLKFLVGQSQLDLLREQEKAP
jgi:hypothetical protein